MGVTIDSFQTQKVAEFISHDTKSVCLEFNHGLFDTIMFYPVFLKLRELFEHVEKFELGIRPEFLRVFNESTVSCYDWLEKDYDLVFRIEYRADPDGKIARNELCCTNELGIEYGDFPSLGFEDMTSPFIAVDFNSSFNTDTMSCSRETAKKINDMILERGYLPLNVHYFDSEAEYVPSYSFVSNDASRFIAGHPERLVSTLERCYAYVGVFGESYAMAKKLFGDNCVLVRNDGSKLSALLDNDSAGHEVDLHIDSGFAHLSSFLDSISNENVFVSDLGIKASDSELSSRDVKAVQKNNEYKPKTFKLKKKRDTEVVYL